MCLRIAVLGLSVVFSGTAARALASAETCTTQSQMKDSDRSALTSAARVIAAKVQTSDAAGLRSSSAPEFGSNFGALQTLVAETAPRLKGGTLNVDQVYLLDASQLKPETGGTEAQFFCSLNRSANDVEFIIPGLSPGHYGFAVVQVTGTPPWSIPMLLRRDRGEWLLAGIYPHSTQAAGHDGLWFWREARRLASEKQRWNAWLYYGEAEALLKPADFIQSTHLEKLREEQRAAAPPAVSAGIGPDVPLVIRGGDGSEYRFTGMSTDDTLGKDQVDLFAHLRVDQVGDVATARKRNEDAMRALLAAYPELRGGFHGIWIVAEGTAGASGQPPFATEEAMSELR